MDFFQILRYGLLVYGVHIPFEYPDIDLYIRTKQTATTTHAECSFGGCHRLELLELEQSNRAMWLLNGPKPGG